MRCGNWNADSSSTRRGSGIDGDMASFETPNRVLWADQSPRGCTDTTFSTRQPLWRELNTQTPRIYRLDKDVVQRRLHKTDHPVCCHDLQARTRHRRPSGRLLSPSAFKVSDRIIHQRCDASGHIDGFISSWRREGGDTSCQRPPQAALCTQSCD